MPSLAFVRARASCYRSRRADIRATGFTHAVSDIPLFFGPFRLDPVSGELWRGADPVPLRTRAAALLHYLAERPGRVIPKAELLAAVWEGTHVTPAVLKVHVHAIREALGDSAIEPRFVQTVGRVGYRFVSDATSGEGDATGRVVGRAADLDHLMRAYATAVRGQRQVVLIAGESGIGKTTLVELFLRHHSVATQASIARGQCFEQYGEGEAYLPLLTALGRLVRGETGARVVASLQRLAPTWLAQLPGADNDAPSGVDRARVTPQRMLREVAEAIEDIATDLPLLLVLEDLHWSDSATLDFLSYVAGRHEPARLLVVGTYRPADAAASAHPLRHVVRDLRTHGRSQELGLELLTPADVDGYVAARFPHSELARELAPLVHERTDGNPLFMVDLVDHLIERGYITDREGRWVFEGSFEAIEVPETVRQVIAKHIEQLGAAQRDVLDVASVAGTEFEAAAVAAATQRDLEETEDICDELVRHGHFLEERGLAEWPDGTTSGAYGFRHALYREVLHGLLSEARRARLHRALGARIEAAFGTQVGTVAAALAAHFEHGRDLVRAAQYHETAAASALARSASREALEHYTSALRFLRTTPTTPERDERELTLLVASVDPMMATRGYGAPEVDTLCDEARLVCDRLNDSARLFELLCTRWSWHIARGEIARSAEVAAKIAELADGGSPEEEVAALWVEGGTAFSSGALARARTCLDAGTALYDPDAHGTLRARFGHDPGVGCLAIGGLTAWYLGEPDAARTQAEGAVQAARKLGHAFSTSYALTFLTMVQHLCGDVDGTATTAAECERLSGEHGFPVMHLTARVLLAWVANQHAGSVESAAAVEAARGAYHAMGAVLFGPYLLGVSAQAHVKAGLLPQARALATEALKISEESGERYHDGELRRMARAIDARLRRAVGARRKG